MTNTENPTRIEPQFRDEKQKEYNRMLIELECQVSTGKYNEEYFLNKLNKQLLKLVTNEEGWCRLLQSIIELTGTVLSDDNKLVTAVYWIWYNLREINISLSVAKLLELVGTYVRYGFTNNTNDQTITIKQRNVCIVLNLMTNRFDADGKVKLLTKEVISMIKLLIENENRKSVVLYAISCLSTFLLVRTNRVLIDSNLVTKLQNLQNYVDLFTLETFYISKFDYVRYQIGFLARWCLEKIGKFDFMTKLNEIEAKSSLNPDDCSADVKLSPDRLSVGNGFKLERIRASYPVTCGVFYYEAILLTGGDISFGWTTKSNIDKSFHDNKYTILLCCFHEQFTHNGQGSNTDKSWQAGDVVGCLIDIPNKKFQFYLNGQLVEYRFNTLFFSTEPYFAAVAFTHLQQAYYNFGQVPFKHPPPSITYRTFHGSISKYINDKLCPFCNLKPTGARFVNCDHWKLCSECLVKLKKCPTCNQ